MKSPVYVIVRFEVKENEFDTLHALISEFFEKEVSKVSGFVSAKIHRNDQGTVLINYATWESVEAFTKFKHEIAFNSEISKQIQKFPSTSDNVFEIAL